MDQELKDMGMQSASATNIDPEDRAAALSATGDLDVILETLEKSDQHKESLPRRLRRNLVRMGRDRIQEIRSALHQP